MISAGVIVIVNMIIVVDINIISAAIAGGQYARQIYAKLFKCWNVKINTAW